MKSQKPKSNKPILFVAVLFTGLIMPFCFTPKKLSKENIAAGPTVFYEKDIRPIMTRSCTPCHFPVEGRKKMLDNYIATKNNILDILERIQLPTEDKKFMPFKSKKAPLTTEEIALFKNWYNEGMAEK